MQFGAPSVSQKGSRSGQLLFVLQERNVSDNGASLFDILQPGSGAQQDIQANPRKIRSSSENFQTTVKF